MQGKNTIVHQGEIIHIEADHVDVRVWQASACSTCAAAQLCKSSESKEKVMKVPVSDASSYSVGETVRLYIDVRLGLQATLLAYVVPLVLIVAELVVVSQLGGSDALAALVCLLILVIYYGLLYAMRRRISRKFEVKLIKNKN